MATQAQTDKAIEAARAKLKGTNGLERERKERFVFPDDHIFVLTTEQMNDLLDVCRHLYDLHDSRVASKMYAILRNATSQKL